MTTPRHNGGVSRLRRRRESRSTRAHWLGARAANALRRRGRLLAVSATCFLVLVAVYALAPAGVAGLRRWVAQSTIEIPDTSAAARLERRAQRQFQSADSTLSAIEQERSRAPLSDSIVVALVGDPRRDSLLRRMASLTQRVLRAQSAPLPESYRALAADSALASHVAVQLLADSLEVLERARDRFASGGAGDPLFIALTTRVADLGHRIESLAQQELAVLREAVGADTLNLSTATADSLVQVELTRLRGVRDSLQLLWQVRREGLQALRTRVRNAERAVSAAGTPATVAPMPVLLLAAAIVSLFVAFALLLADEMRSPRVASAAEAERLTNRRVLAEVGAGRERRGDDVRSSYQVAQWHLASDWRTGGIVVVLAEEADLAAAIGVKLAAAMVEEARSTLLVDGTLDEGSVSRQLGLPHSSGLAAVVEGNRDWSEVLVNVPITGSRSLDVLPAGVLGRMITLEQQQLVSAVVRRAARRYDACLVVAPLRQAAHWRAGADVLVCAVRGRTRLATLARAIAESSQERDSSVDGTRVRGIMLWGE